MAETVKLPSGETLADGDRVQLTLKHGTVEKTATGTVYAVKRVERILDADGYAVDKTTEVRWEITGAVIGPRWGGVTDVTEIGLLGEGVTIGFLPENVLRVAHLT